MLRWIFSSLFLLLTTQPAWANELPLPAFSPYTSSIAKPEAWLQQPIQYADEIQADLVISLDQQLYDALLPLIDQYARDNKIKISVTRGTCGTSAGELNNKRIDIAGFCCPPGNNDRLPGLKWHTLGISPIALIVHPDNPIESVSLQQAREIFSGQLYHWEQLSANQFQGVIHPVGRLHCKLRYGHWRLLLGSEDEFSPTMMEVGAIPDMIRTVATDNMAVGYESPWMISHYQETGHVKAIAIDGTHPEMIGNHPYPLYRTYNLTTWSPKNTANPYASSLIQHLMQNLHQIDDSFYFIPAPKLYKQGWKFDQDELIGEPEGWR